MNIPENFNDFEFRCSSLGKIMTGVSIGLSEIQTDRFQTLDLRYRGEGKPLTPNLEKEHAGLLNRLKNTPALSKTVRTYLETLFKEIVTGKRKEIDTDEMWKGKVVEQVSMTLHSNHVNELFIKNTERRTNGWISGEPDIADRKIIDIKSSWNLHTFPMFETDCPSSDYRWQLLGYMFLWPDLERVADLAYCLVDTPEEMIQDAVRRWGWRRNYIEVPEEEENDIRFNMTFEDIDKKNRVKIFVIEYSEKAIEDLKVQIGLCREYLNQLADEARKVQEG